MLQQNTSTNIVNKHRIDTMHSSFEARVLIDAILAKSRVPFDLLCVLFFI